MLTYPKCCRIDGRIRTAVCDALLHDIIVVHTQVADK